MYHFLLHDADLYRERLAPAIAASARTSSLAVMQALAVELAPLIDAFARRHFLTSDERPLIGTTNADRLDRRTWRFHAGELLYYTALESLETTVSPGVLRQCVPSEWVGRMFGGSRGVEFQGVPYRPGRAGLHDEADIAAVCKALSDLDPASWRPAVLQDVDESERGEEMEWLRGQFAELRAFFERARTVRGVIVCEEV